MDIVTKKNFDKFSDTEIIQKIIIGEIKLFEILIRRNNPFLYKTGRAYGYNHEDTQDLMQETFISAYLNLSKFENRSSFKTWIIKIMLNNCFQKQQKFSFKNENISIKPIHENLPPMYSSNQHTDTSKTIINRELNHVIEHSLEQVPIDYRIVFSLREISGLNVAETAEALNISESNVKVRLNRAKSMLRKEIEKKYTAEDIFEFNLIYCTQIVDRVMNELKTLQIK
ncbi:MAG TPA: sigma-70 family RNA polymerase sigma factor [Bacteroidia bacterium]|jgi:RNA polymerase sigma factor (sigma-70 family)|nr:sigma-70 family RNA polymerase sigma factor [Bacteroidia bacterium]